MVCAPSLVPRWAHSREWGINYPTFMKGLILIVPAARSDQHFHSIVDAVIGLVTLDPAYKDGKYTENPVEDQALGHDLLPVALQRRIPDHAEGARAVPDRADGVRHGLVEDLGRE